MSITAYQKGVCPQVQWPLYERSSRASHYSFNKPLTTRVSRYQYHSTSKRSLPTGPVARYMSAPVASHYSFNKPLTIRVSRYEYHSTSKRSLHTGPVDVVWALHSAFAIHSITTHYKSKSKRFWNIVLVGPANIVKYCIVTPVGCFFFFFLLLSGIY